MAGQHQRHIRSLEIIDSERLVLAGMLGQKLAVGTEGNGPHRARCGRAARPGRVAPVSRVPEPYFAGPIAIPARLGQQSLRGMKRHGLGKRMSGNRQCFQAAARIPQANAPIAPRRGQMPAIGAELHGVQQLWIASEAHRLAESGLIPDAHQAVTAGRGEFAVAAKGHRQNAIRQAFVRQPQRAGQRIPDTHFSPARPAPARRGQKGAVAVERHGHDLPVVPGQRSTASLPAHKSQTMAF